MSRLPTNLNSPIPGYSASFNSLLKNLSSKETIGAGLGGLGGAGLGYLLGKDLKSTLLGGALGAGLGAGGANYLIKGNDPVQPAVTAPTPTPTPPAAPAPPPSNINYKRLGADLLTPTAGRVLAAGADYISKAPASWGWGSKALKMLAAPARGIGNIASLSGWGGANMVTTPLEALATGKGMRGVTNVVKGVPGTAPGFLALNAGANLLRDAWTTATSKDPNYTTDFIDSYTTPNHEPRAVNNDWRSPLNWLGNLSDLGGRYLVDYPLDKIPFFKNHIGAREGIRNVYDTLLGPTTKIPQAIDYHLNTNKIRAENLRNDRAGDITGALSPYLAKAVETNRDPNQILLDNNIVNSLGKRLIPALNNKNISQTDRLEILRKSLAPFIQGIKDGTIDPTDPGSVLQNDPAGVFKRILEKTNPNAYKDIFPEERWSDSPTRYSRLVL